MVRSFGCCADYICLQSRKDSHIKTFENQALALRRELEELVKQGDSEFCCEVPEKTQQETVHLVVREFERILQNHRERDAKWYNDGMLSSQCEGRLALPLLVSIVVMQRVPMDRWQVSVGRYRNAPHERQCQSHASSQQGPATCPGSACMCTKTFGWRKVAGMLMCREQAMYDEWIEKQSFLRQADRMVARVRHR